MLNAKIFESFDVNALTVQNYSSGEISIFLLNFDESAVWKIQLSFLFPLYSFWSFFFLARLVAFSLYV